jgi:hypothetical protein
MLSTTGRGLRVVAALATRWGIEVGPTSKSVWVELEPSPPAHPVAPEHTMAAAEQPREHEAIVRLRNLPVRAAVASGMQVDELVRELQMGIFDREVSAEEQRHFYDLLDRSARLRLAGRRAALGAAAAGAERFDVDVTVSERMTDALAAFRSLLEVLPSRGAEATAAPLPAVVAFRDWLDREVAAQLGGAASSRCPLP